MGLLLERIDCTRKGVRFRYELTDENGVWERCLTLKAAQEEIGGWENKEIFFIL